MLNETATKREQEDNKVLSDMKEILAVISNFEDQVNNLYVKDEKASDLAIPAFYTARATPFKADWANGYSLKEWSYGKDPSSTVGKGFSATVILDTVPESQNTRTTTMVVRFPRLVLSEFNTHRVFSRNSASSRARSVRSTIESLLENPVIPIFTKNKPGMSGPFVSKDASEKARVIVEGARDKAVASALELLLGSDTGLPLETHEDFRKALDYYYSDVYKNPESEGLSIHKQAANRLLEPYLWHEVVVTSSEWVNFFKLRLDLETTDPHMLAVTYLMAKAYVASFLDEDTHLLMNAKGHFPFQDRRNSLYAGKITEDLEKIALSVSEAATVSYRDKNGDKVDAEKALALTKRLLKLSHASPFEHVAFYTYDNTDLRDSLDALGLHELAEDTDYGMSGNLAEQVTQLRVLLDRSPELKKILLAV